MKKNNIETSFKHFVKESKINESFSKDDIAKMCRDIAQETGWKIDFEENYSEEVGRGHVVHYKVEIEGQGAGDEAEDKFKEAGAYGVSSDYANDDEAELVVQVYTPF